MKFLSKIFSWIMMGIGRTMYIVLWIGIIIGAVPGFIIWFSYKFLGHCYEFYRDEMSWRDYKRRGGVRYVEPEKG